MSDFINPLTGVVSSHFISHSQDIGQLVYWHKYAGDHIQVRQSGQLRWLLINDTLQSVIELNNPQRLLFLHLTYLAKQWQTLAPPNHVLELGLGGGAIRNYLQYTYPQAHVTSVEKNADIIACYTDFFALKNQSDVQCDDAQNVLSKAHSHDWIILDLFSQIDAPRFLFERAFYQKIYDALNAGGTLFINFLSQHESQLIQLQQLLFNVFGVKVSPHKIAGFVNHIIIVTKAGN
ncbi:SAM-dependent methyltransferase [uncultured Pseudoalteromonas sp.]|uniref:spermidine synthase n=1 Tax=uncultured Pseudoalteromonas sp. TaxID=114053 RepID=UPI002596EF53|nr:SAM-dependent methyltransferase [uncultured Pseudoalteromonas sp.]